jgi:hypothetical protein
MVAAHTEVVDLNLVVEGSADLHPVTGVIGANVLTKGHLQRAHCQMH